MDKTISSILFNRKHSGQATYAQEFLLHAHQCKTYFTMKISIYTKMNTKSVKS